MRSLALALAAFGLAVAPWVSAPAAAARAPSRAAAAPNADRGAVEAARRFLCPHGGMPRRGGRCRGGGAMAVVAGGGGDASVRGWDAGLPAVTRRQAPCPGGTVQARVLFWDDAVRCVPR